MRSDADPRRRLGVAAHWFGVPLEPVSVHERLVSALGAAIALAAVIGITEGVVGLHGAVALIAPTGASAVLLFGVPHGLLSQPWPALGGHVLSAVVGVTCSRLIDNRTVAAACALGLAVGLMHQCRCVHPPGGATALIAVIGGPAITDLGYSYVVRPVLLNIVTVTAVAVLFNGLFRWRRYPMALARTAPSAPEPPGTDVSPERLREALRSLDSFIDVTEDDLQRLHRLLSDRSS